MKYMILLYGSQQDYDTMAGKETGKPAWSAEDIKKMVEFMGAINNDLTESGELVDAQGLDAPALTRRVQFKDGAPVVTDGPYAETTEVIAGYWIVDVAGIDRATEIAARVTMCPGAGGTVGEPSPVDIRPIGQAPAPDDA
ncbi:YciI family protein [Amycolatopsis minnesotensis]|uniref:YciI family protein n=1 Tax=Amycolatopsis minnesotensis TaxID=337894 RepID=A0ABN2SA39_9PSEU